MNTHLTEQQQRIKNSLFELYFNTGKGLIQVEFFVNDPESREKKVTNASRGGNRYGNDFVLLTLVEPTNNKEIDDWAEAIVTAEELVQQVEREKIHETLTPNFFKSVTSEFQYKKLKSK